MVDDATDELVGLQQEVVRIASVNTGAADSANEIELCRVLERRFAAEGIESTTLESAPGRGNFIASLPGAGPGPRLMFMTHLDVVPVEDQTKWDYPPFGAEIHDGKIYGRGSDDNKCTVTSGTMAMFLLKRAGIAFDGELRFLAAADEESGGNYGIKWLAEHHPDQTRADYAINEGGGTPVQTIDGGQVYLVSIGEKGRIEATFTLSGAGAHGARPWDADNPLYKMAQLLQRLRSYQDAAEIDLRVPVFDQLALFGIDDQPTAQNIDGLLNELEASHRSLARGLKGMSRMSISPTMTAAGSKSNSIPGEATLICDIRTLPHQDEQYVRRELDRIINGIDGVSYELDVWALSNASPADGPFVELLKQATETVLDRHILMVPSITTGFTDSRCVRPLGTAVYGFQPLTPDSDTERAGVHGVNEAMEITNLVFRTKMQLALAYLTLTSSGA